MTENERIAAALRTDGFFYHQADAGKLAGMSDEEILAHTEGTLFRARVERALAGEDMCAEIKKLYERPAVRVINFLLRIINRFKRGNDGTDA